MHLAVDRLRLVLAALSVVALASAAIRFVYHYASFTEQLARFRTL